MAQTYTDFSQLSPALNRIGDLFAGAGTQAVQADLARVNRGQIVADTAIKQQSYGINKSQQEQLADYQAAFAANPLLLNTPEGRALAISLGTVMVPGQGMAMADPAKVVGSQYTIDPGEGTPDERLSRTLTAVGTQAYGNTPTGYDMGLGNARAVADINARSASAVAQANNQGELSKIFLQSLLPKSGGAGDGTGGSGLMDVGWEDPEKTNTFYQQAKDYLAAKYPGVAISDADIREVAMEAAKQAAISHSEPGALDTVIDERGFGTKTVPGFWPGTTTEEGFRAPAVAKPSGAIGSEAARQFLEAQGIDLGSLLAGQTESPGPAAAPNEGQGPTTTATELGKRINMAAQITRDEDGRYWGRDPEGKVIELKENDAIRGPNNRPWKFHNGKYVEVK